MTTDSGATMSAERLTRVLAANGEATRYILTENMALSGVCIFYLISGASEIYGDLKDRSIKLIDLNKIWPEIVIYTAQSDRP